VLRRSVCTRAGTHGRLAPLRHPDLGIPLPILGGPSVSPTGSPALPPALGGHTLLVRLRTPRPASDSSSISKDCAYQMAGALLCSVSILTTATSFAGSAASTQALIATGMLLLT
jgi:hypothetical protein